MVRQGNILCLLSSFGKEIIKTTDTTIFGEDKESNREIIIVATTTIKMK